MDIMLGQICAQLTTKTLQGMIWKISLFVKHLFIKNSVCITIKVPIKSNNTIVFFKIIFNPTATWQSIKISIKVTMIFNNMIVFFKQYYLRVLRYAIFHPTHQQVRNFDCTKNKVFYHDTQYDHLRRNLRIWSYLLKKLSVENFICCAVFMKISKQPS